MFEVGCILLAVMMHAFPRSLDIETRRKVEKKSGLEKALKALTDVALSMLKC